MFDAELVGQLIRRQIEQRYRGSVLGMVWSVLTPLFMLAVFTFVFGTVLQARWTTSGETSTLEFAIILFASLTTFNLFAEVVTAAPTTITSQPNLVKKVVFPLEVLPLVSMGAALFQGSIAFSILLAMQIAFGTGFHPTALVLPFLLVPLCLFTLGIAWFLAAFGVFVRDVGQIIPTLVTALMFLSPILYPSTTLPPWIRPYLTYNPMAFSVEDVRNAVIFGKLPDPATWLFAVGGGLAVAALGYAFFQKTRKGFADVL